MIAYVFQSCSEKFALQPFSSQTNNISTKPMKEYSDMFTKIIIKDFNTYMHNGALPKSFIMSEDTCTAWKVSVFEVFLARIQSECGKIQTRKTPNTDAFHAAINS